MRLVKSQAGSRRVGLLVSRDQRKAICDTTFNVATTIIKTVFPTTASSAYPISLSLSMVWAVCVIHTKRAFPPILSDFTVFSTWYLDAVSWFQRHF